MKELKPCSCCYIQLNVNDKCIWEDNNTNCRYPYKCIRCPSCGMKTDYFYNRNDAIKAWNSRPIEYSLSARINKLENGLKRIKTIAETRSLRWNFPDEVIDMVNEVLEGVEYGNKTF